MDSTYLRQRIRYYTDLLEETQEKRRKAEEGLEQVRVFASKRQRQFDAMQQDLASRRSQLVNAAIDSSRVRIMRSLAQGMSDFLDQGNVHLSRMESQKYQISRAESGLEDQISQCRYNENSYTDTLADLRRQLRVAQAEEAADNV